MKTTFKESYGVLQRHAQTLRTQTEPNIDDLLSIVEESVAAYKVCQERIDAVEKALEKALLNAQQQAGGVKTPKPRAKEAAANQTEDPDGDIPF